MVILTNLGQLRRDIFCAIIRLKNHSKLVEGSLFAIIDLLLGAKFISLYFIRRAGGYHFHKKISNWKKKKSFSFTTFNFFTLLQLHRPYEAVETSKASPWYEQSCLRFCIELFLWTVSVFVCQSFYREFLVAVEKTSETRNFFRLFHRLKTKKSSKLLTLVTVTNHRITKTKMAVNKFC